MKKTTYWIIFIGISLAMAVLFILAKTVWEKQLWITDLIGLIGVLLSLGGVVMALIQIAQSDAQIKLSAQEIDNISKQTDMIKQAVEQNRDEIRDFMSISEIAHLEESIRNAQAYVMQRTYTVAVHMIKDIKDNLMRTNSRFDSVIVNLDINMTDLIKNLNIDIDSLTELGLSGKKKLNETAIRPSLIYKHLEEVREATVKIESYLKQQKL